MPLKRSPPTRRPVDGIDHRRARRIVEARIEVGDVVGGRVPRRPEGPAEAALDGQVRTRLPRVLHEHIGRERAPLGQRAFPDLGVIAEQAQRHVRDRQPGPAGAVVEELERPVLVVGAAGNRRDVDLVEIVFARVLDDDAGLERVAALDHRRRVRERVDRAARERRVGAAVDGAEPGEVDRRDLVLDLLAGEEVRIGDVGPAPLVQSGIGEHVDEDLVERIRVAQLVEQVLLSVLVQLAICVAFGRLQSVLAKGNVPRKASMATQRDAE